MTTTQTATRPATDKQIAFLTKLAAERDVPTGDLTVLSTRQASTMIDGLLKLPKAATAKPQADPEVGMYVAANGTIVRAYLGQQSGRVLAKKVVGDQDSGYSYEYLGLASKWLVGSIRRMTLEEAKSWGTMTGTCCVCARQLDVPESVEAGIGPVCARKF